jgi:MFS family permease
MTHGGASEGPKARLLTPRFLVVVASGACYFTALGALGAVVPRYVDRSLGGGEVEVGIAMGAFALGAILLRPIAGRIGDRYGRRVLMVSGAAMVGTTALIAGLVASLPYLVATRVGMGLGEAAFFVGATTMATDLAPVERRGEAVSYWSIAVWGGMSLGPVLGYAVLDGEHYGRVWVTACLLGFTAAAIALGTRETGRIAERSAAAAAGGGAPPRRRAPLIARAAVRPGVLLALVMTAMVGFQTFLPLYAPEVGVDQVGFVFLVFGVIVLGVRVAGARLPDILGPVRAGTIAITATVCGLGSAAAWQSAAGLWLATVLIAVGAAFLYPALLLLALHGVPHEERGSVVGTFSACFDFAGGTAGISFGAIVALTSYRGAYSAVALLSLGALVLLRGSFGRRRIVEGDAAAAALAADHLAADHLEPLERLRGEEPGVLP